MGRSSSTGHQRGSFRVIGGQWRGRRLSIPAVEGVRPTPDRVRETLFNWLAPIMEGARCLDLYAGSGALGVEALSRGAAAVTFVDRSAEVVDHLRAQLQQVSATDRAQLLAADAMRFVERDSATFDVIFLDPPFGSVDAGALLEAVAPRLKPYNRVYLETDSQTSVPETGGWEVLRDKRAGQVRYRLLTLNRSDD